MYEYMSATPPSTQFTNSYIQYLKSDMDIAVCNRLHACSEFYRRTNASSFVQAIVDHGYTMPFASDPEPILIRNNKSARDEPTFVHSAMNNLLMAGVISESTHPPTVVNPLSVAKKGDKKRLVLDCRHINAYINTPTCKMEGHDTLIKTLHPNSWLVSFDLKAGYHHVMMAPSQRQYLEFAYPDHSGKMRYVSFCSMPFGLSPAIYVFTQLLCHFIKMWRSAGIEATIFVDDGLAANTNRNALFHQAQTIKSDLIAGGWVPNKFKCIWIPVQTLACLGTNYDMLQNLISITPQKVENALQLLSDCQVLPTLHVKLLAKVLGKIISFRHVFENLVFIKTRYMQLAISATLSWDEQIIVDSNIQTELQFWINFCPVQRHGKPI